MSATEYFKGTNLLFVNLCSFGEDGSLMGLKPLIVSILGGSSGDI